MQGDLASKLTALAGCSIATLKPSEQLLLECNRVFTNATHQRFERRTLLGLVINAMRPEHGQERVRLRAELGALLEALD